MASPLAQTDECLLHIRTARRILADLRDQALAPGARLRPLRELATAYQVSYQTIQRSLQVLKMQGFLEIRQGDGMYLLRAPEHGDLGSGAEGGAGPARARARRIGHTIATVYPSWASNELPQHFGQAAIQRILQGFIAECDRHQWGVEMVYSAPPDEAAEPGFVHKLLRREADGVLWLRPNLGHRMNLMRLLDRNIEVVGCGRQFPGLKIPTISEDHAATARLALSWLKKQGKKRVGMLTGPAEGRYADPFAVELLGVYQSAAAKAGVTFSMEAVYQGYGLPQKETDCLLQDYFRRNREVDGFICVFNPLLANIERISNAGDLPQIEKLRFVDLTADYRPVVPGKRSHLHLAGIRNPLENLGCRLARHFVEKWFGPSETPPPPLTPEIFEIS